MTEPRKRARLVSDYPSPSDRVGGAHSKLAKSLASIICCDEGGKVIGLEGSWGSGKSTAVELLGKELPQQVFIFDSWAHRGDPLRRVFLEGLIDFLWGKVDSKVWTNRKEELLKRKRSEERIEIPTLTWPGILFTVFSLALPIGTIFFSSWISDTYLPNWVIWLGFILAASSPLFLAGLFLTNLIHAGFNRLFLGTKDANVDYSKFSFFLNKSIVRQKNEIVEMPDPTSVEFERIFSQLLEEALAQPDSRLVIVLDNLDRVDSEVALQLWSVMRTFLEASRKPSNTWSRQLWVIVPYDHRGIEHILNIQQMANRSAETINSFLDKSFQLRVLVPPPLLTDWKSFLLELLRIAFPDHPEGDIDRTCAIFSHSDQRNYPTPRSLKLFVNDVVTSYYQWENRFPIYDLAYFSLLKAANHVSGHSLRQKILDDKIPDPKFQGLISEEFKENLAIMAFNVELEKVQYTLLEWEIQRAWHQPDGKELAKLATLESFGAVFNSVVRVSANNWQDPRNLHNLIEAIRHSKIRDNGDPQIANAITFVHSIASKQSSMWGILSGDSAKGFAALIEISRDAEERISILRKAVNLKFSSPQDWVSGVVTLLQLISELRLKLPSEFQLKIPTTSILNYLEVCRHFGLCPDSQPWWKLLTFEADPSEIFHIIDERIQGTGFSKDDVEIIRVLIASAVKFDKPKLAGMIKRHQGKNFYVQKAYELFLQPA